MTFTIGAGLLVFLVFLIVTWAIKQQG